MADTKPKTSAKKEEKKEPTPVITFVEAELNQLVDYMNFMQTQCGGSVPLLKMTEYNKHTKNMIAHIKKVEEHILEVKRVMNKPKGE